MTTDSDVLLHLRRLTEAARDMLRGVDIHNERIPQGSESGRDLKIQGAVVNALRLISDDARGLLAQIDAQPKSTFDEMVTVTDLVDSSLLMVKPPGCPSVVITYSNATIGSPSGAARELLVAIRQVVRACRDEETKPIAVETPRWVSVAVGPDHSVYAVAADGRMFVSEFSSPDGLEPWKEIEPPPPVEASK